MKNKILQILRKGYPFLKVEIKNVKRKTFDVNVTYNGDEFTVLKARDWFGIGSGYWDIYVTQFHILPPGIEPIYVNSWACPGNELYIRYHLKKEDENEMRNMITNLVTQMLLFKIIEHWHNH